MLTTEAIARVERDARPPADAATRRARGTVGALGAWLALVTVAIVWGEHVVAVGDRLRIHAPPLSGDYRTRIDLSLLVPLAVAAAVIGFGPRLSRRLSWPGLVLSSMAVAVAWAIALGLNDGWGGLSEPLLRGQYLRTVPLVGDPLDFLRGFTGHLASYNIHTQGHPPGMVLTLWGLDRIGLVGTGPNLALVLAGGGASVGAALVALRDLAGEDMARGAAAFVALAPAMIWWSSGDAFFAGVSAWAVTLVILATGRAGRVSDRLALAGGLLFGVAAMLSYGLVLLAIIPFAVAIRRRRARPLVLAAVGTASIVAAAWLAGFSWITGLEATRRQYWAGVASRRPYSYFLVGNLAAFALAIGPATAVALARLRDRRVGVLVWSALAAIAVADLSGMSKAEVERIWLPFVPWVLLAGAALVTTRSRTSGPRLWLAGQCAVAIGIQTAVRSPW